MVGLFMQGDLRGGRRGQSQSEPLTDGSSSRLGSPCVQGTRASDSCCKQAPCQRLLDRSSTSATNILTLFHQLLKCTFVHTHILLKVKGSPDTSEKNYRIPVNAMKTKVCFFFTFISQPGESRSVRTRRRLEMFFIWVNWSLEETRDTVRPCRNYFVFLQLNVWSDPIMMPPPRVCVSVPFPQACQRSRRSMAWRTQPWRETTSPWPASLRAASPPPTCAGSGTRRRLKVRTSRFCGKPHQTGQVSSRRLELDYQMIAKRWQPVVIHLQKWNMFTFPSGTAERFFWFFYESNDDISSLLCWARWTMCRSNCLNRISPSAACTWNELFKKAGNIIRNHRSHKSAALFAHDQGCYEVPQFWLKANMEVHIPLSH